MAWKHDVDRRMIDELGELNYQDVSPVQANQIVQAAVKQFGLGSIKLYCTERETKSLYGTARKLSASSYEINLRPSGMRVFCILHEIAHCFSDGYDHYIGWTHAYFRLVEWFKIVGERFAVQVNMADYD